MRTLIFADFDIMRNVSLLLLIPMPRYNRLKNTQLTLSATNETLGDN
jgi:hypothetical protein